MRPFNGEVPLWFLILSFFSTLASAQPCTPVAPANDALVRPSLSKCCTTYYNAGDLDTCLSVATQLTLTLPLFLSLNPDLQVDGCDHLFPGYTYCIAACPGCTPCTNPPTGPGCTSVDALTLVGSQGPVLLCGSLNTCTATSDFNTGSTALTPIIGANSGIKSCNLYRGANCLGLGNLIGTVSVDNGLVISTNGNLKVGRVLCSSAQCPPPPTCDSGNSPLDCTPLLSGNLLNRSLKVCLDVCSPISLLTGLVKTIIGGVLTTPTCTFYSGLACSGSSSSITLGASVAGLNLGLFLSVKCVDPNAPTPSKPVELCPKSPPTSGPCVFSGCYTESTAYQSNGGVRALTGGMREADDMTVEDCRDFCLNGGFTLFGVESGTQCFCGNSLAAGSVLTSSSSCNSLCGGDSKELCGGESFIDLYTCPSGPPGGCQDLGCYTESTSILNLPTIPLLSSLIDLNLRALSGDQLIAQGMTIEICATFCRNYDYFGLEAGSGCFCGNSLAIGSVSTGAICNVQCTGNANELCGGSRSLSLFRKTCPPQGPPPCETVPCTDVISIRSDINLELGEELKICAVLGVCTAIPLFANLGRILSAGLIDAKGCTFYADNACSGTNLVTVTSVAQISILSAFAFSSVKCWDSDVEQPLQDCPPPCKEGQGVPCATGLTVYSGINRLPDLKLDICVTLNVCKNIPSFDGLDGLIRSVTLDTVGCLLYPRNNCRGDPFSLTASLDDISSVVASVRCFGPGGEHTPPDRCIEEPPKIGECVFDGCYSETQYTNLATRALSNAVTNGPGMTIETCADFCLGYTYFGLEFGSYCFCGNTIHEGASSEGGGFGCDYVCAGNDQELCGGFNYLDIYTCPPFVQCPLLGCYTDSESRALTGKSFFSDNDMTIEKCQILCVGFKYYGVEFRTACFCGDNIVNGAVSTDAAECGMTCAGDSNEICGGSFRINIYSCEPPASSTALLSSTMAPASSTVLLSSTIAPSTTANEVATTTSPTTPCYTGEATCINLLTVFKTLQLNSAREQICGFLDVCASIPAFGLALNNIIRFATPLTDLSCTIYSESDCTGESRSLDGPTLLFGLLGFTGLSVICSGPDGPRPPAEQCPISSTAVVSSMASTTSAAPPCSTTTACSDTAVIYAGAGFGGRFLEACVFLDICAAIPEIFSPFNLVGIKILPGSNRCRIFADRGCGGTGITVSVDSISINFGVVGSILCFDGDQPGTPSIDPCSPPNFSDPGPSSTLIPSSTLMVPSTTGPTSDPTCVPPVCEDLVSFYSGPFGTGFHYHGCAWLDYCINIPGPFPIVALSAALDYASGCYLYFGSDCRGPEFTLTRDLPLTVLFVGSFRCYGESGPQDPVEPCPPPVSSTVLSTIFTTQSSNKPPSSSQASSTQPPSSTAEPSTTIESTSAQPTTTQPPSSTVEPPTTVESTSAQPTCSNVPCIEMAIFYDHLLFYGEDYEACTAFDTCTDVPFDSVHRASSLRLQEATSCRLFSRSGCGGYSFLARNDEWFLFFFNNLMASYICYGPEGPQEPVPISSCPIASTSAIVSSTGTIITDMTSFTQSTGSMTPSSTAESSAFTSTEQSTLTFSSATSVSTCTNEPCTNVAVFYKRHNYRGNPTELCAYFDICTNRNIRNLESIKLEGGTSSCTLYYAKDCSTARGSLDIYSNQPDVDPEYVIRSYKCFGPDGPQPPVSICSATSSEFTTIESTESFTIQTTSVDTVSPTSDSIVTVITSLSGTVTAGPTFTSASVETNSPSSSEEFSSGSFTISTVYTTTVYTVTSCPPTITNCPTGHVTTETISLTTTICPVTSEVASTSEVIPESTQAGFTTSTIYTTTIYTVTSCHPTVTNCPMGYVTTEVISHTTTICPITVEAMNSGVAQPPPENTMGYPHNPYNPHNPQNPHNPPAESDSSLPDESDPSEGANQADGSTTPQDANQADGSAPPQGTSQADGSALPYGSNQPEGPTSPQDSNQADGSTLPQDVNQPEGSTAPQDPAQPGITVAPFLPPVSISVDSGPTATQGGSEVTPPPGVIPVSTGVVGYGFSIGIFIFSLFAMGLFMQI